MKNLTVVMLSLVLAACPLGLTQEEESSGEETALLLAVTAASLPSSNVNGGGGDSGGSGDNPAPAGCFSGSGFKTAASASLVWESGSVSSSNYATAVARCSALGARLPTRNELHNAIIAVNECPAGPAGSFRVGNPTIYWTTDVFGPGVRYHVNLGTGSCNVNSATLETDTHPLSRCVCDE